MMFNPAFASIDAVKNDRFVTLEYVEATQPPQYPRRQNARRSLLG